MNSRKTGHEKLKIALLTVFLILLVGQGPQASSSQANRELEMTVRLDATTQNQSKVPKFRMDLQNVGDHDLVLNLGLHACEWEEAVSWHHRSDDYRSARKSPTVRPYWTWGHSRKNGPSNPAPSGWFYIFLTR